MNKEEIKVRFMKSSWLLDGNKLGKFTPNPHIIAKED